MIGARGHGGVFWEILRAHHDRSRAEGPHHGDARGGGAQGPPEATISPSVKTLRHSVGY